MINKKRLIRLTQDLIKIRSENPLGNESQIADFVKKHLKSSGLSVQIRTFKKGRPNVLAIFKGSSSRKISQKEALILTPHLDTVPAGLGWKEDPFGARIKKGRIYGRGATDDKGNLAVGLEVLRSLSEDRVRLKRDIIFAATADEETGSHYGIIPLLKKNILKGKYAIILDSDEFDTIIAQKGLIHARIKIFGKKAHGAYNWRGVNAIEQAAKVISRLKNHKFRYTKHSLMRGPTVNIGTITGGEKVNMVADFCEFSLDVRYLPGMNPKKILREIRLLVCKDTRKFKIEADAIQHPYEMDPKHAMVNAYIQTALKMKAKAQVKGCEGATVITFFKNKGIPAFATGFGTHGTAHTNDEFAKINILIKGARILEEFLKKFDS